MPENDRNSNSPLIAGLEIQHAKVSYDGGVTFSKVNFLDHNKAEGSAKLEVLVDSTQGEGILTVEYTTPNTDSLKYSNFHFTAFSDLQNYPILAIFNQPDMARTWVPCQDTLSIKTPVEMRIDVPAPFTALTTGIFISEIYHENKNRTVFKYYQPTPVAAQQLTLTMGYFEMWKISERVSVWMEMGREIRDGLLMETDALLDICEGMVGPYVWETLNIVIIPDKMGYKGEKIGPNTIYLPVSMFQTSPSPIQDDTLRVQVITR